MAQAATDGPIISGVAVTPNDSTVLATTRGVYVGGAGNVAITWVGNSSVGQTNTTFVVAAGTTLPIRVVKILATGTTATNIVALY